LPYLNGQAKAQRFYVDTIQEIFWNVENIMLPLRCDGASLLVQNSVGVLQEVDFVRSIDRRPNRGDEARRLAEQTLAAYIGDLTKELSKMARAAHYEALARLLDHASSEARDIDAQSEARLPS
jgi:hypothetical protein